MPSAPEESDASMRAQQASVKLVGVPNRLLTSIFEEPLKSKALCRRPATQAVVPVTVPLRAYVDESEAVVPLVSLSFKCSSSSSPPLAQINA